MDAQSGSDSGDQAQPWSPPQVNPSPGNPPPPPAATPPTASSSDPQPARRTGLIVGVVLAVVVLLGGLIVVSRDGGDPEPLPVADTATGAAPTTTGVVTTSPPTSTIADQNTTTAPETTTTTTDPGVVQGPGEIFLEPADSEGPESFTGELFLTETSTTATDAPPATAAPAGEATGPATVEGVVGDTPGLYGGTRDNAVCDKAAQLQFLQDHPDKANAFVEALNGDAALMWSGGTTLGLTQLPDYFAELTPIVLTRDTRVTNHGFRDGRPTSRQVVLQAGTAVLVDRYGVPRARCLCGNPLTTPQPVEAAPVYTGVAWPGFDPTTIVVVNQTTVVIDVFVLVDVTIGGEFIRPAGSDGSTDAGTIASVWQIDLTATLAQVDYFNTTSVAWTGQFTIGPDGTIAGTATGMWTFDADCYEASGAVQSTSSAQGSYTVDLTGQAVTTELGRFVTIVPILTGFTIDAYAGDPPVAECEADIFEHVESWVAPAFTTIELQAEVDSVFASYESDGFVGEIVLTPIG